MKKLWIITLLFLFYLFLVAVDLGLNLLGLFPYVGTAFETASEAILELLGLIIVIIISMLGLKKN